MYEVAIESEACVLLVEIIDLVNSAPTPGAWTSDWDAQGYRELEFRVVSGVAYDECGNGSDLGRNGCAEIAERYAEQIEEDIWRQLDVAQ